MPYFRLTGIAAVAVFAVVDIVDGVIDSDMVAIDCSALELSAVGMDVELEKLCCVFNRLAFTCCAIDIFLPDTDIVLRLCFVSFSSIYLQRSRARTMHLRLHRSTAATLVHVK